MHANNGRIAQQFKKFAIKAHAARVGHLVRQKQFPIVFAFTQKPKCMFAYHRSIWCRAVIHADLAAMEVSPVPPGAIGCIKDWSVVVPMDQMKAANHTSLPHVSIM